MGPVAAAIKLCLLSDSGQPIFSQDTIDLLHAMQLSAYSFDHRLPTTLAALPSLLRDILARVPRKKLDPGLLSVVVSQREDGGVEMLAMLLDHGLNINYRKKQRVSPRDQFDAWVATPGTSNR
ncbi:hypothetical protein GGR58DRAFT_478263 [Xylaria digitata]|nr:hypothetical protein GGR58DRAFT_478263 [Xylaria digitata]